MMRRAVASLGFLFALDAGAVDYFPCEYEVRFYVDDSNPESDAGKVAQSIGDTGGHDLKTLSATSLLDDGTVHPVREGWYSVDIQIVHDGANEFNAVDGDTLTFCVSKVDTALTATATDACVEAAYDATSPTIEEGLQHALLDQPLWALELETVNDAGATAAPDFEGTITVRLKRHACKLD